MDVSYISHENPLVYGQAQLKLDHDMLDATPDTHQFTMQVLIFFFQRSLTIEHSAQRNSR